jgi:hypothetical protein
MVSIPNPSPHPLKACPSLEFDGQQEPSMHVIPPRLSPRLHTVTVAGRA